MNHSEEKRKRRGSKEKEEEEDNTNDEEEKERKYEDEDKQQKRVNRRERAEAKRQEQGERRQRRHTEREEREKEVEGEQNRPDEGRDRRQISPEHIPLHPIAAPYLKWKVFVKSSEDTLKGRNVREEPRERQRFTSILDGEATRNFYESLTAQTDREVETDSNRQKSDSTNRDSDCYRQTERQELADIERKRDRDRQSKANRSREAEIDRNTDNRQRERHRHPLMNRLQKRSTDKDTQKSTHRPHQNYKDTHSPTPTTTPTLTSTPQDVHAALRLAQNNDIAGLTSMLDHGMSVNTKDIYGWSLLMVAACAGAVDVVQMLLTRKARTGFRDAKGNTALYLATISGHQAVTEMLIKANKRRIPEDKDDRERNGASNSPQSEEDEEYFCDTCGISVKVRERTKHKASIVHQFKTESGPPRTHYAIPPTNRGYQLLVGQGWDTEAGLGPEKQGQKFPVKTVLKRNREGLGAKGKAKEKARVTHFGPGDAEAVRRSRGERVERAATVSKREMRRRRERQQQEDVRLRRMLNEPDY